MIGQDRTGDPLLSMEGSLVANELARVVMMACFVGSPAPLVQRMSAQMTNPQTGDKVFVQDSLYRKDDDTRWKGSGYLLGIRIEAHEGTIYYIQYGPNAEDVCRWGNCSVWAFPDLAKLGW